MIFNKPIKIKELQLKNRVFLAPLAGVSDIPFRRICQEKQAGLTYVEMLSSVAIAYGNKKTFDMMARHPKEEVLGVQVTGPGALEVEKAISILDKKEFEALDINMGCPVRKVVGAGCGSAILKDQPRLKETVEKARAATSKPLSIKVRIGYTVEDINIEKTAENVASSMADIHGRTRADSYAIKCRHSHIQEGINIARSFHPSLITVGNGDLFSYKDALEMHAKTGCDALMVSRGALGNPWIFEEILNLAPYEPTFEEWYDLVRRHMDYQEEHYGKTKLAAILMRKHLLWYSKGYYGSKALRERLNSVESLDAAKEILASYALSVPKSARRYKDTEEEKPPEGYDPKFEMDRVLDRGVGDEGL
jgi:tRNA-dihydrouridine synthase B